MLLSDVEDDEDHAPPLGNPLIPSGKGILRKPMLPRAGRTAHSSHENTLNEPAGSSRQPRRLEDDEEGGEDSDIEEIEYGYETDMLLIMPSMLRDYSHHATNYHPELWHAPIPGSRDAPSHPTVARCRQEGSLFFFFTLTDYRKNPKCHSSPG